VNTADRSPSGCAWSTREGLGARPSPCDYRVHDDDVAGLEGGHQHLLDESPWPTDLEPIYQGYAIGHWIDTTGNGSYHTLEVETRGPLTQTFEGRGENLSQANKLSRTYTLLLDALNRHRGKGQQKVTVEHVHVHSGGQAVVGMIETPGGGDRPKPEEPPHAPRIAHAPQPTVWSANKEREPVPVACDAERPLPDARRKVAGRPER
jgi:hypothetical protein